ncbi:MAG: sulfite exporter TauE/SafE family protein [Polyangiaceae bacterium]|nr:sulfite exporter TauE/SafE family protein [Polyangiaceae bacterium]
MLSFVAFLVVGILLGLLGGGGSILAVPAFTYIVEQSQRDATWSSLLLVAATSSVATFLQHKAKRLETRVGLRFSFFAVVGAFLGARLSNHLPTKALFVLLLLLMTGAGASMLRRRKDEPKGEAKGSVAVLAGVALFIGILSGTVGVGGGFLIVPALVMFGGLPMDRATGTSVLVIALQSWAGLAGHADKVRWEIVRSNVPLVALSITGSFLGVAILPRVKAASLRRAFGAFVLLVVAALFAREFVLVRVGVLR